MNIKGKIVNLRAMELSDQEFLQSLVNDPEIEKLVGGYSFPVSQVQQENWFVSNQNSQNNIRLVIEVENKVVGLANLVNIDWKNRCAFHGVKLANNFQKKGIGTDSVMAVMRYAFEELGLNRLDTTIIDYNEGSKKLYCEKCGWSVEGIKRQAVFKGNAFHDELFVGILKEDYIKLVREKGYWE